MRSLLRTTAVAVLFTLSGCASTLDPPGESRDTPTARIVVDNVRSGYATLTVEIVPSTGAERRLGTVDLNQSRRFTVSGTGVGGQVRLRADPLGGPEFLSPTFTLADGDLVEWDLHLNQILYGGDAGSGGSPMPTGSR